MVELNRKVCSRNKIFCCQFIKFFSFYPFCFIYFVFFGISFVFHFACYISLKFLDCDSRSARVLLLLVVPGHMIFNWLLQSLHGGDKSSFTPLFTSLYLLAALIQVNFASYMVTNRSCSIIVFALCIDKWYFIIKSVAGYSSVIYLPVVGVIFMGMSNRSR